jgi:hypothetical protein
LNLIASSTGASAAHVHRPCESGGDLLLSWQLKLVDKFIYVCADLLYFSSVDEMRGGSHSKEEDAMQSTVGNFLCFSSHKQSVTE